MSEWIAVEQEHPISDFHVVFITDGKITCLARFINDPESWYGKDLTEWSENLNRYVPLEEDGREPHWLFETCVGPFKGDDECFGSMGDITHWMHLPIPPNIS